jgi:tetratricopeptide (TPR) repeat protein
MSAWAAFVGAAASVMAISVFSRRVHARVYNARGVVYYSRKDYDRAIADSDQAIQLDPKFGHAYSDRGRAYCDKEDYDRAIADYDQAIQLDPKCARAYVYDAAVNQNAKDADSLFGRGMAKLKSGDSEGGNADIAAAKAIEADIADMFEGYGIK